jgi:hydrogenase nickel incorporation protein HypB
MCDTCGCESTGNKITYSIPGADLKPVHNHSHDHHHGNESHSHDHHHEHGHEHSHEQHSHSKSINVEVDILSKNNLLAERNRGFFEAKRIKVLNLMSSPGSGKTTLLEKTIKLLSGKIPVTVIEGDQQTMNDAVRIQNAGAPAIQINTGNGCHLDSSMISKAVKELDLKDNSVLFIENVGNLVCPSLFDLGESARVVIISTTEGEDKPAKYPTMFENADLCVINKTDLLPYLDFSIEKCKQYARTVNNNLEFIELSAKTEEGMQEWIAWIKKGIIV